MIEIAQQSKKFQAKTISRWLGHMLEDDEEVVKLRSSFRTRAPESLRKRGYRRNIDEFSINVNSKSLKTFIQRRKINRGELINAEINR